MKKIKKGMKKLYCKQYNCRLQHFSENLDMCFFYSAFTGTKEAQHIVRSIEKLQKENGKLKREYETQPNLEQSVIDSIKTLSTMKIREILR